MDIQADSIIDRDDIAHIERLIRPHIRQTPVIEVDASDFGLAATLTVSFSHSSAAAVAADSRDIWAAL